MESAARFPPILGVCVRIRSGADGHDGDGDDGDGHDGDGDGVIIVPEALRQVSWLRQR